MIADDPLKPLPRSWTTETNRRAGGGELGWTVLRAGLAAAAATGLANNVQRSLRPSFCVNAANNTFDGGPRTGRSGRRADVVSAVRSDTYKKTNKNSLAPAVRL